MTASIRQLPARKPTAATVTITGNYGTLNVCADTGAILRLIPFEDGTEYADITRFDLEEWRTYWDADPAGAMLDICDVGFWAGDQYIAAEEDWRQHVREVRETRRLMRGTPVLISKTSDAEPGQ